MNPNSFSKNLREQFQNTSAPDKDKTKETIAANEVSQMLGFIGSMAVDVVFSDLKQMIEKNKRTEIDGYVLALSRIMKHDIAFECIEHAFREKGEPMPKKYRSLFVVQKSQSKPKGITVE